GVEDRARGVPEALPALRDPRRRRRAHALEQRARLLGSRGGARVVSALPTPYFLARPADAPRAGVVVLMEGIGMSWQLLRVCERLAAEGYLALAPDIFHRAAAGHGEWQQAIQGLRAEDALADIRESVARLRDAGVRKVGITGFCMGGRF